jgi:hypothetical protein
MILRFLFYAFLLYMAYKLVANLIIPVYRTTKRVRKGFREMQERMQQNGETGETTPKQAPVQEQSRVGDYIDFEEIK